MQSLKQFFNSLFFESCTKNVDIAKLMKTSFLQLIVSLITSMCDTTNLEERILILYSFSRSYSSNKLKSVKCILIHSVVSLKATQKCDDFPLPGAENFLTVYKMNYFVAKTFRRYYTIKKQKGKEAYRAINLFTRQTRKTCDNTNLNLSNLATIN